MIEAQKKKRKIRSSKKWKIKKLSEKKRAENKDEITLKPLRKGWQLHHMNLDESFYENLSKPFMCVNNLTHKMIHWLYTYYKTDKQIIERLKKTMEIMERENGGSEQTNAESD